jgi:hypothetical protein
VGGPHFIFIIVLFVPFGMAALGFFRAAFMDLLSGDLSGAPFADFLGAASCMSSL